MLITDVLYDICLPTQR